MCMRTGSWSRTVVTCNCITAPHEPIALFQLLISTLLSRFNQPGLSRLNGPSASGFPSFLQSPPLGLVMVSPFDKAPFPKLTRS